jgi:hypothetical protein
MQHYLCQVSNSNIQRGAWAASRAAAASIHPCPLRDAGETDFEHQLLQCTREEQLHWLCGPAHHILHIPHRMGLKMLAQVSSMLAIITELLDITHGGPSQGIVRDKALPESVRDPSQDLELAKIRARSEPILPINRQSQLQCSLSHSHH